MKTINQSIEIKATREAIWAAIVNPNKYQAWTGDFHEGSRFEGFWQKGARLKFLANDENGEPMGMISEVTVYDHLKDLAVKPVAFYGGGVEDYSSEELQKWTPTLESYHIETVSEGLERFTVTQTIPEEYFDMLNDRWTPALAKLKEVCEQNISPFSKITVETTLNGTLEEAWFYWTRPEKMTKWNFASEDWHCPSAAINLEVGGEFTATMAAKDGSMSFDFWGIYTEIEPQKHLATQIGDGRQTWVDFESIGPDRVRVVESFEAEGENSLEMQQAGWQAILNNYKKAVEEKL